MNEYDQDGSTFLGDRFIYFVVSTTKNEGLEDLTAIMNSAARGAKRESSVRIFLLLHSHVLLFEKKMQAVFQKK